MAISGALDTLSDTPQFTDTLPDDGGSQPGALSALDPSTFAKKMQEIDPPRSDVLAKRKLLDNAMQNLIQQQSNPAPGIDMPHMMAAISMTQDPRNMVGGYDSGYLKGTMAQQAAKTQGAATGVEAAKLDTGYDDQDQKNALDYGGLAQKTQYNQALMAYHEDQLAQRGIKWDRVLNRYVQTQPGAGGVDTAPVGGGLGGGVGSGDVGASGFDPSALDNMTRDQRFQFMNNLKNQPKDMEAAKADMVKYSSALNQINDAIKNAPIAASGSLAPLENLADKNTTTPVAGPLLKATGLANPARGDATVALNFDSLGNVLDNLKGTFGGRITNAEMATMKQEMNAAQDMSSEQKAIVLNKIKDKLTRAATLGMAYQQDIKSGKAYLPNYTDPFTNDLQSQLQGGSGGGGAAPPASAGGWSIKKVK